MNTEPRIVNVSPHLLMDVNSCETKAWVRHVKGFTSKGDAIKAVAGQGFHKATEVLLDPASLVENRTTAAVNAFHTIYDDAFLRLAPEKLEPSLTPTNLERVLQRWIQMHPPAMLPWKRVLAVEEAFCSREWYVGEDGTMSMLVPGVSRHEDYGTGATFVRLIVRPDLVVEDHDGRVRWVDTKTTGWHITDDSWKKALRMSLQTQLYSDAVVQRYGDRAIYAGWINAIELRTLPSDPKRKCQTHKVTYAECGNEHAKAEFIECMTTAEKVAAAVREAEDAARLYVLHTKNAATVTACNVRGTSNNVCRFCPAADWCDTGRPDGEGALESFFIHEPWVIEEGRRA